MNTINSSRKNYFIIKQYFVPSKQFIPLIVFPLETLICSKNVLLSFETLIVKLNTINSLKTNYFIIKQYFIPLNTLFPL